MNRTLLIGLLCFFVFACHAPQSEQKRPEQSQIPVSTKSTISERVMVVSAHPIASKIGVDIMKQGGNAYDAAVAVQFALAVCYPRAGNIGGGGFMVSRSADGQTYALDFREKAPKAASRDMYLDKNGDPIEDSSTIGYLAVGVPGSVAGMVALHERFGKLPWKDVVQPAIDLAKNGFSLTQAEAEKLNDNQQVFYDVNAPNAMVFLNDAKWKAGEIIRIPELAETLTRIQQAKFDGFYKGETAREIAGKMKFFGGIITQDDLASYQAVWREPLHGTYKDYDIISMPPPSSGGVALLQLLNGVELHSDHLGTHNSTESVHLLTELERRVYADRATYLGDSDFFDVPVDLLTSKSYAAEKFSDISWTKATPSSEIKQGSVSHIESVETTHYSIVDEEGNAVAITTTLNGSFGSKVYLSNLGFFLNNEMDDFSIKPGVPNMFGLVGSEANKIEPEKRMLSSMTPTIVEHDGKLYFVVGTPGGATIITSVFQSILNVVDYNMTMQNAVNAKKTHSQWLPDQILIEEGGLSNETIEELTKMGHVIETVPAIGRVDAIKVTENQLLEGAADPRGDDSAEGY